MSFDSDITPRLIEESGTSKIFEAEITRDWFIITGPNGGFIAALLLRAMRLAQAEPNRAGRSLTIHYISQPKLGLGLIETNIIRKGRNLTYISAHFKQDKQIRARAVASFSTPYDVPLSIAPETMPEATPFNQTQPIAPMLPVHSQFEMRPAFGILPFSKADRAISGGWTILKQPPENFCAEMIAAISDCWPPAFFSIIDDRQFAQSRGAPTIELSVYFIQPQIYATLDPAHPVLAKFYARELQEGFMTEDGEIWTQQGQLLAHVRQIAIAQ